MTHAQHDRRIDYIEFSVKSVPDAKRFYGMVIYAADLESMEQKVVAVNGERGGSHENPLARSLFTVHCSRSF